MRPSESGSILETIEQVFSPLMVLKTAVAAKTTTLEPQ